MPFTHTAQPIFYFQHTAGQPGRPPLVLAHGAGGHHLHWPAEVRRLPGQTVYALDLPGHGQSAGAPADSVPAKAEAILALLDDLRVERAVIGGHSLGGGLALWLALAYPDRVAGLVLVGTGARLRVAPEIMQRVADDLPGAVELVLGWMFGPAASEPLKRLARKHMLATDAQVMLADWRACDQFDLRARLGEIHAPAVVITGSADQLTPEKHARFLAENLAGAELHLLPGGGHMVMLEQPRPVAQIIAAFLARLNG